MTTTYTSQQATFLQNMIAYLQNTSNWPDGLPKVTDFTPGSVAYTLLAAIATGLDQIGLQYFDAQQQASILTATDTNLDDLVALWGVTRKPAVAASGAFTFVKNVAAVSPITIPAGTLITTLPAADGTTIQYVTSAAATLATGATSIQVTATCSNPGPGSAGNLTANTQLLIGSAVPGIDGVQLTQDITNGVNAENDGSLRARCLQIIQNPQGGGTLADYQQWALSVTGVTTATVLPLNRGPGTVDIVITASNGIPSSSLLSSVQTEINNNKPVNVDAQAIAPTAVTINVGVATTLASGYTLSTVTAAVQTAVTNYINSVPIGGTVYSSGVVAAVLKVQGILDCQVTLTVPPGGSVTNVVLTSTQMAVAGTITVS